MTGRECVSSVRILFAADSVVGSVIVDVDAYQVLAMKRCLRIYGYRDISFFELFYFDVTLLSST